MLSLSGYPRPCEFSLLIEPLTCASFSVSCVFRQESVVFSGRILISFGFSGLSRAPAPWFDHGLYMFDKS